MAVELVEDFNATVKVPVTMTLVRRGNVPLGAATYAHRRIGELLAWIAEPILSTSVELSMVSEPALARPAIAEVTLDIDGDVVRARIEGHDMREAVDLLQARLRDQLEHRSDRRHAPRQVRLAETGVQPLLTTTASQTNHTATGTQSGTCGSRNRK